MYDKKLQEYNDKIQLLEIELQEHSKADFDYKTTLLLKAKDTEES